MLIKEVINELRCVLNECIIHCSENSHCLPHVEAI